AVDNVADGHLEAARDLVLQPLGRAGVDGIARDHTGRRHREDRVVIVVPEAIDLARDLRDLADRRLRGLLGEDDTSGQEYDRDGDGRRALRHDASVMALTAFGFSSDESSPGALPR